MSAFKDQVAEDIHNVFLNLDDFASVHVINGREMPCIIESVHAQVREKRFSDHIDGTYALKPLIHVAASDFGSLPESGASLKLDGRLYRVIEAAEEMGMYAITVSANRGRNP